MPRVNKNNNGFKDEIIFAGMSSLRKMAGLDSDKEAKTQETLLEEVDREAQFAFDQLNKLLKGNI